MVGPTRKPFRLKSPVVVPWSEKLAGSDHLLLPKAVVEIEAEIDAAPVIDCVIGGMYAAGARGGGTGEGGGRSEASVWPAATTAKAPANTKRFMRPLRGGFPSRSE